METERTLKLVVKKDDLSKYIERIALEYQKKAKIQGFRPGKAPLSVVKNKFKKEIEEDALKEYLKDRVIERLEEEKAKLASFIYIKEQKESNSEIEVEVVYEVLPYFEVRYNGIKVKKVIKRASPDEVEKRLKKYQEALAEYRDKEKEAKDGDLMVLKYSVKKISGEEVLKDKTETVKLTKENVPFDFYQELKGKKKGESFKVARNEEQGTFIYEGEILSVKEIILPPLDDNFAKMYEMENMESFKKKISEEIDAELREESEMELEHLIMNELSKLNPVPVPKSYVEEEVKDIISRYNFTKEEIEKLQDDIWRTAEEKIRRRLLLDRLAEQIKVEVKEEEIDEEIRRMAKIYKMNEKELRKNIERRGTLGLIEDIIKRKKAMEFLKRNVKMEAVIE
jgi:trigger factor